MPKMINLHELLYTEITKSEAIRPTSGATSQASSSEPQQEVYKQYTVKVGNRKYTAHNNKTVANYTAITVILQPNGRTFAKQDQLREISAYLLQNSKNKLIYNVR